MSKVVFILGAGASRQCGAPLMHDFLDKASDLLLRGSVGEKCDAFKQVFKTIGDLQAVHSKSQLDLNNIESIFTVLELAKVIKKLPSNDIGDIPKIIAALKTLIVTTLEETIEFPTEGNRPDAPEPYANFADLLKYLTNEARPQRTTSVITFNYDIAVDMGMYCKALSPDYVVEKAAGAE